MRSRDCWGRGWAAILHLLVAFAFGSTPLVLAGEEYVMGPEDVISVSVWEHPELSRTAVVRANGTITMPPLGDLAAAGKTTTSMARDLEAQIYASLRQTTQVTVSVVAFNSRKVYLSGQVNAPGKYSFEEIPALVDLLGQSGGLGAGSDLSAVRILRREGEGQKTLQVDLGKAIRTGDLSGLPPLEAGDVVFVPPTGPSATGGAVSGDAVYILGEVLRPGSYPASGGIDLAQAVGLAGGMTPRADLSRIDVLARGEGGESYRLRVDLEAQLRAGNGGPEIRPGDTIRIPSREAGPGYLAWNALRAGLGTTRDILNLILIRDALNNNNGN